jgi:hypothetical protein
MNRPLVRHANNMKNMHQKSRSPKPQPGLTVVHSLVPSQVIRRRPGGYGSVVPRKQGFLLACIDPWPRSYIIYLRIRAESAKLLALDRAPYQCTEAWSFRLSSISVLLPELRSAPAPHPGNSAMRRQKFDVTAVSALRRQRSTSRQRASWRAVAPLFTMALLWNAPPRLGKPANRKPDMVEQMG